MDQASLHPPMSAVVGGEGRLGWLGRFDDTATVTLAWDAVLGSAPAGDRQALDAALAFAVERHEGQVRRGSTIPYWIHVVRVALELHLWGARDADVLVAALLHDVVEDCDTTAEEVRDAFGVRAAALVVWLTSPPGWQRQAVEEHYEHLLTYAPPEARLIKLSDRVDNLRSMEALLLRDGPAHAGWARAYLDRTRRQVLPLAAHAPSVARAGLLVAMADLAVLVAQTTFTHS